MRLGIKAKQVIGVTAIVGVVVVALIVWHVADLARVSVRESQARTDLLSKAIYQRASEVIGETPGGGDVVEALRADRGLQSILTSSLYANNVAYAAIVDVDGRAVAHADPALEGTIIPSAGTLDSWLARSPVSLLLALYGDDTPYLETRQPLRIGFTDIGSIRIGVSTVLIWQDVYESILVPALTSALVALGTAVVGAMLLSQVILRPIHVIKSGLTRLGRGEFGVRLDLDQQDEFGELGTFFNSVSAQLSADRQEMAGQVAQLESAVDRLEDAVAIVNPSGDLLFANPAMRGLLPDAAPGARLGSLLPEGHAVARLVSETQASQQPRGPVSAAFEVGGERGERLVVTHPVHDAGGAQVGVLLTARNLEYLGQVESTLRYSRKLAALGRLSAGVAHEVKNPLNAMMIHLELLRQQIEPAGVAAGAAARDDLGSASREHVDVIAHEIRRLDEVVQGFLKFVRPEELTLQPVSLDALWQDVVPIIRPEAERHGVTMVVACAGAPDINGDAAMLRQALVNLALNACQAMPRGGTLTIRGEPARGRRVLVTVSDTGTGIDPQHLSRIFDLYFTTKERGSGIGLSMVYRTVQMHDGEIQVASTVGKGTTFSMLLPQA
jgi:signal transduction histidine kinase